MAALNNPFMDVINKIKSVRTTQVVLPIARKTCLVSSLLVGDDLALRSSISNPVSYDRELIKILHEHTIFVEEDKNVKLNSDVFVRTLSAYDKLSLIWGLYNSTYDILSTDRKLRCQNKQCEAEFSQKITMTDLIHDDTYTLWSEELPFYEFFYPIEINYGEYASIEFKTKIPSIKDSNALLGRLSIGDVQNNLDKTGDIYTKGQYMALVTSEIRVIGKSADMESAGTTDLLDVLRACEKFPQVIYEEFFEKYNEMFNKYSPKFYKKVECPQCATKFDYSVELETEFFRRSLLGRQKS